MELVKPRGFENKETAAQYAKQLAKEYEKWCATNPVIVINN